MSQRDVWNRLSIQWATFRHKPQEAVPEFLKDKRGLILDVGCGAGRNLIKGKRFVAIDFAKEMVEIGRKKLIYRDDIDFAVADANSLPFRSNTFDSVLLVAVLHCIYPREHDGVLKEINRVMKPGSYVLVTVWNKATPKFFLKSKESFMSWRLGEKKVKRYYYLFTKKELREVLEKNGFEVTEIRGSEKKDFNIFPSDIIAIARKKIS